jgi:pilus assembly protein CpaF
MTTEPTPDETAPQRKRKPEAPASKQPPDVSDVPTVQFGSGGSPAPEPPASAAGERPPEITDAPAVTWPPAREQPVPGAELGTWGKNAQRELVVSRQKMKERQKPDQGATPPQGTPGGAAETSAPPAPPNSGPDHAFWLQGQAVRVAARIEVSLQTDPVWQASLGRTPEKRRAVRTKAQAFIEEEGVQKQLKHPEELELLLRLVEDELLGYGPLEPLLADEQISEVMVVDPTLVYVERAGKMVETPIRFQGQGHMLHIINAILRPLGRSVSRAWPLADGRLPDGSRVNVVVPPAAVRGPTLTIRKFARTALTLDDLVRLGTISAPMAELLRACVIARLNIVVSGGTSSGKTTLLNALSACIPADERIITIEDAAELQLQQRHVVTLEATPAEPDGSGRVSIRDLVVNSLRMRPERIIVGECRSGEALDMLQAMNTGHDGSLTTAHANSPRDCLTRLETMVMMAGLNLPLAVVRRQVVGALQIIVHQARLRDGSRKVTHITEIQGLEGDTVILQDLFRFRETGLDPETNTVLGKFEPGGFRPRCYPRFEALNIQFPPDFFVPEERR